MKSIPFTKDQQRFVNAVNLEAGAWLGTPFAAHQCVLDHGVDCARLCLAVLLGAGLNVDLTKMPAYHFAAGGAAIRNIVMEYARANQWSVVPLGESRPGDVVHFRIGNVSHHTGVMIDGNRFVHALARRKVSTADLRDPTYGRILGGFLRHPESPFNLRA